MIPYASRKFLFLSSRSQLGALSQLRPHVIVGDESRLNVTAIDMTAAPAIRQSGISRNSAVMLPSQSLTVPTPPPLATHTLAAPPCHYHSILAGMSQPSTLISRSYNTTCKRRGRRLHKSHRATAQRARSKCNPRCQTGRISASTPFTGIGPVCRVIPCVDITIDNVWASDVACDGGLLRPPADEPRGRVAMRVAVRVPAPGAGRR